MDLVSRAKAIILKPKEEWVKIKGETTTVAELFTSVAVPLAAIPAIAQFIGYSFIGRHIPFIGMWRMNPVQGLIRAAFSYVLTLVSLYVFALIINALAPTFGSVPNQINALKLALYSMIPGWIAGVLFVIPYLGWIAMLAGIYGLYILYLGFMTPMMETPKEKVMGYLVVSIIAVAVLYGIVAAILGAIFSLGHAGFRFF